MGYSLYLYVEFTRSMDVAEQLVAIPDAGVARKDGGSKEKRTAAEVNLIGSIMGRSDGLRSRYFRRELAICSISRGGFLNARIFDGLEGLKAQGRQWLAQIGDTSSPVTPSWPQPLWIVSCTEPLSSTSRANPTA